MQMTKQHFELIAATLREDAAHLHRALHHDYRNMTDWEKGAYHQWSTTVLALADALATTNFLFDRERFLKAAGVQS